jgi:predicted component of type VI protein secretion system
MTIGRGADADWRLNDPARLVSKAHCRIDAQPHGYVLIDISTNGILVNDEPLGFQGSRLLTTGDRLRLGDVDIGVVVDKGTPKVPARNFMHDGPFGNESLAGMGVASLVDLKEIAATNDAALPSDEPIKQDWLAGLAGGTSQPPPKAVDILDRATRGTTQSASLQQPEVSSFDAIVISLVQSFPNLDVPTLAYAVDTAGAVISEDRWRSFYERLRAFLREKYPDDA